jgi:ankyrin repeat protein
MTELLEALYRGDDDRVSQLLSADPALSVFEAAAFGRTDRLRELLDGDPSLANAFGSDGFQPLGLACFFGRVEAARLLLDRGANPNTLARNEHIQAGPLHSASASENNKDPDTRYELCELLLDRGADPNLAQGGGFTALDAARQNGDDRLERLLLDRGARTDS